MSDMPDLSIYIDGCFTVKRILGDCKVSVSLMVSISCCYDNFGHVEGLNPFVSNSVNI